MTLSVHRIREAIKAFVPKDFSQNCPLDVSALAKRSGFQLRYLNDVNNVQDIAGAIDYEKWIIYVSTNDSEVRQRFTMAHELGHYVLHKDLGSIIDYRDPATTYSKVEIEANTFAAELLMPKDRVIEVISAHMPLVAMINIFQVSKEAMRYRIDNLLREEEEERKKREPADY